MRCLGRPSATALVIPPCASTSSISACAFSSSSRVSASTYQLPPSGSATAVTPLSSARISWVLRAIRAEKSVGSAIASSKLLVCSDCVPPSTAASASIVVRTTLLYGSCSVSDTPLVWQCVRSSFDFSDLAPRSAMIRAHRVRAARSLATSMNRFMPMPKKKLRRGAKASMSSPLGLRDADIFHAVGERVGELLHRRRPGLVHVIAGDRDRVELGHFARRVSDDVGDDPHRGLGRVDVGVADRELFQDVVLDRARQLRRGRPPAPRPRRCRRPCTGSTAPFIVMLTDISPSGMPSNSNFMSSTLSIATPALPTSPVDARMVAVVAAVGGEIEGDAQALLPGGEVAAVEGVAIPRRSRSRHIGGSSTAARHTSSHRARACRARGRDSRCRSRAASSGP